MQLPFSTVFSSSSPTVFSSWNVDIDVVAIDVDSSVLRNLLNYTYQEMTTIYKEIEEMDLDNTSTLFYQRIFESACDISSKLNTYFQSKSKYM